METKVEETTPQKNDVEETPKVKEEVVEKVEEVKDDSISRDELKDLKSKADVSSQNFERAKKAEDKVKSLEDQLKENEEVLPEIDTEEETTLKSDVASLKKELSQQKVIKAYPEMEEVWDKFEEFRTDPDNKGMNMNTAAKAFRIENGLADTPRKGLEKTTGGDRIPISNNSMSADEVRKLRETNYKKYREMVKKDQINIQ